MGYKFNILTIFDFTPRRRFLFQKSELSVALRTTGTLDRTDVTSASSALQVTLALLISWRVASHAMYAVSAPSCSVRVGTPRFASEIDCDGSSWIHVMSEA